MTVLLPARVVHMTLDNGAQALTRDHSVARALVIFWHDGVPLGQKLLDESALPLSAAQMADVAAHAIEAAVGWRLFSSGFNPPDPDSTWKILSRSEPAPLPAVIATTAPLHALQEQRRSHRDVGARVAVVVCTRDRGQALARCLRGLVLLQPMPDEIIVVDNAPHDEAARLCVEQFPHVRYVREPRAGLSRARNAGVRASSADIIAFTDDDVEVNRNWIAVLLGAMRDPSVAAVTGLVLPASLDTEARWIFERTLGGFGQGYRSIRYDAKFFAQTCWFGVPVWRIGAGANMALRRSALTAVGGFDERLGAGASGCSEDSEMWYRLLAAGYVCLYEPSAVVLHDHRETMRQLRHQMRAYMKGHVAALLVQWERHGHRGNLHRIFVSIPWYYLRLACRNGLRLFHQGDPTLWAQVRGVPAGIWYFVRHRATANAPSVS